MFFIVLFSLMIVMDVFWWRWADGRLRPLRRARLWRTLLAGFVGVLMGSMLLFLVAPALMRRAHGFLPLPIHAAVYLWHLLVLPLTCVVILVGTSGRGAVRAVRRLLSRKADGEPLASDRPTAVPIPGLSRRQFLGAAAAAAPPLVVAGMTSY